MQNFFSELFNVVVTTIKDCEETAIQYCSGCDSACLTTCFDECTNSCGDISEQSPPGCQSTCEGYCSRTCTGGFMSIIK